MAISLQYIGSLSLSYNFNVTICTSSCSKAVWTDYLLISMCSEGLTLSGAKRRQCQPRRRFLLPDEAATVGAPSLYKEESVYYWWLTTPHPCKKSLIVLKRASNSRHSCWKMMMAIPGLKLLTRPTLTNIPIVQVIKIFFEDKTRRFINNWKLTDCCYWTMTWHHIVIVRFMMLVLANNSTSGHALPIWKVSTAIWFFSTHLSTHSLLRIAFASSNSILTYK